MPCCPFPSAAPRTGRSCAGSSQPTWLPWAVNSTCPCAGTGRSPPVCSGWAPSRPVMPVTTRGLRRASPCLSAGVPRSSPMRRQSLPSGPWTVHGRPHGAKFLGMLFNATRPRCVADRLALRGHLQGTARSGLEALPAGSWSCPTGGLGGAFGIQPREARGRGAGEVGQGLPAVAVRPGLPGGGGEPELGPQRRVDELHVPDGGRAGVEQCHAVALALRCGFAGEDDSVNGMSVILEPLKPPIGHLRHAHRSQDAKQLPNPKFRSFFRSLLVSAPVCLEAGRYKPAHCTGA